MVNSNKTKNNLDWFHRICETLKKENHPTVKKLISLIGSEKINYDNEIRGSKFLIPFDERFKSACINPILNESSSDAPVSYLSFQGCSFIIRVSDIANIFEKYRLQENIYDGGTQIFFYPIPNEYEFSAIALWINQDIDTIDDILNVSSNNIAFYFGENLYVARDGYYMG